MASTAALIVTTLQRVHYARVAAESFVRWHPEALATVVVVDDRFGETVRRPPGASAVSAVSAASAAPGPAGVIWRVLTSADVLAGADVRAEAVGDDTSVRELARLRMCFDAPTLVDAVRLRLLANARLDTEPLDSVLLSLADDAFVVEPMSDVISAARTTSGFVACRVRTSIVPNDGRLPDRRDELREGTFDDTTFAIGSGALEFMQQWAELASRSPLDDIAHLDPVRTRWLDLVVSTLESTKAVSVLDRQILSYRNADVLANAPVVRFPGFAPNRPWRLSAVAGAWPRVLLSAHTELAGAASEYAAAVQRSQGEARAIRSSPFATLHNGQPIDAAMRHAYRTALISAERERSEEPPNPFVAGEAQNFVAWLAQTHPGSTLSRYLHALRWQRSDLRNAFGNDDGALQQWAETKARDSRVWIPRNLPASLAASSGSTREFGPAKPGINVVGLLSAQLGVGEHGRLTLATVQASGLAHSVIDHDATVSERDPQLVAQFKRSSDTFPFDIDLLLVNADQTGEVLRRFGRGKESNATIGLWAWEVERFPERMHYAFSLVEEVWVLSDFVRDALQPAATEHGVRVHTFPMLYPTPKQVLSSDAIKSALIDLGLEPTRPFFAFAFDYFSVAERKQPWAVVEAFCKAFPTPSPSGPMLVIKSMNHQYAPLDRERLLHSVRGRNDIVLIEKYLPAVQRDALIAGACAYVSLHRAEGFGLTLAEAMSVGTPVIATDWSGNRQFMTPENSYLVPYELVPIAADTAVYAGLGSWAEPSISVASDMMRRILDDPVDVKRRAAIAQADVQAHNSSGTDVAFLFERLRSVRQRGNLRKQLPSN